MPQRTLLEILVVWRSSMLLLILRGTRSMSVKIIGLNAVVRRLDLWQKRLGNRLLLWDRLERDFQTAEKRWFMLGGLGTWRALDPNTAKQKHGRPKLVQSGRLRDSLTTRKAVLRKNTRELWLGTTVP